MFYDFQSVEKSTNISIYLSMNNCVVFYVFITSFILLLRYAFKILTVRIL